jgi:hypothetical protein
MKVEPFEVAEGGEFPLCRQLSVFLENRLGQLLRLTKLIDSDPILIRGIAVEGTVDCAIVRLIVTDPEAAVRTFRDAGYAVSESEVLIVEVPPGHRGIIAIASALIKAEVNINYVYTMWGRDNQPALAVQVDNMPEAVNALLAAGMTILNQNDL